MPPKLNLEGRKIGRWTVIKESGKYRGGIIWLCKCECGNFGNIRSNELNTERSKSCGCYKIEKAKNDIVHGFSRRNNKKPEYSAWLAMKNRCYNEKYIGYKSWGGRGIKVCDRWLGEHGFINFYADMGPKPTSKHSLDRYPDNDGNYEASNCRWATKEQQSENRAYKRELEYNGEIMMLSKWAKRLNTTGSSISRMMKRGKDFNGVVEFFEKKKINATINN